MLQPQNGCDLLHGPYGSPLLPLEPLSVLFQNMFGVLGGKLHQLLLGADLGHPQIHFAPSSARKPLLDQFLVTDLVLEHQLSGNKGGSRIELFHEILQNLWLVVF